DFRISRAGNPPVHLSISAPGGSNTQSTFKINGADVLSLASNQGVGIGNYAGADTAMPVDGLVVSGSVGIGTDSPSQKLTVVGNGSFTGSVTASSFIGNGSGLTSLNATNISSGTLADARLSGNVMLLDN